jgi:putative peptidoglycan lipid II flippase
MGEAGIAMAEFSLLFFAASLIALSGLQVLNRAFYSFKDARTPPLVSVGWAGVTAILGFVLLAMHSPLQYAASALALSVGSTLGMLAMFELLRRRLGGIDGKAIAYSLMRMVVAAAAGAIVAYWVSAWLGHRLGVPVTHFALTPPVVAGLPHAQGSKLAVAVQMLIALPAEAGVYLAVMRLLGAPELDSVLSAVRNRRSGPTVAAVSAE